MKKRQKKAFAVGAGMAALAAGAAASYFLSGKEGVKNRKKISVWASKAKKAVTKEIKNMEAKTQHNYNKTVDKVIKNYKLLEKLNKSELAQIAEELKGHWNSISSQIKQSKAPVKKRKAVKKKK